MFDVNTYLYGVSGGTPMLSACSNLRQSWPELVKTYLWLYACLLALEPSAVSWLRLLAMAPSARNLYEHDLGRELGPAGNVAFGPFLWCSLDLGFELRSGTSGCSGL